RAFYNRFAGRRQSDWSASVRACWPALERCGLQAGRLRSSPALATAFQITILRGMSENPRDISALLTDRVGRATQKPFLFSETDGRQFSYSEFQSAVDRAAALLRSQGIAKGDVVSLLLPNGAEYVIAYFACWKLGALAGPVNSLLKEHEIEF